MVDKEISCIYANMGGKEEIIFETVSGPAAALNPEKLKWKQEAQQGSYFDFVALM